MAHLLRAPALGRPLLPATARALRVRRLGSARVAHSSPRPEEELHVPVPWGHISGIKWPATSSADEAKCVVALHGWLDNAASFRPLVAEGCPEHLSVVALDLPGHGRSSHRPPGVEYNFLSWVKDVQLVIEALGLGSFSLLGHSMGGGVSTFVAATYADQVDRLAIIEGFVPVQDTAVAKVAENLKKAIALQGVLESKMGKVRLLSGEDAVQKLLKDNKHLTEQSARTLLERGSTQHPDGQISFTRDLRLRGPSLARLTEEQTNGFVSRVQADTLIMLADNGLRFHEDILSRQMELLHAACSVELEHITGTHHVHMNEPQRVAPRVWEFLR